VTGADRLYAAMDGGIPDRVPAVPKIWVDLGARLTGRDLLEVVQDPFAALEVIAQAGMLCQVDAVRQFHFPARRTAEKEGRVFEVDRRGRMLGEIDMQGGLMTRLEDAGSVDVEDPCFMAYYHFWTAADPLVDSLQKAACIAVPGKELYEQLGCGERQRKIMSLYGDELALIGDCDTATMSFLVSLRGMERAMFDLIEEPPLVHKIMEKGTAYAVEKGKFNIDLGLKVLRLNDSAGNMSVISPQHWREYVYPRIKEVCDTLHAYDPEVRIYCHICGNSLPVAEDLVETGLDCIGPLDPLGGFTPAQMRERVGNAVALLGGVNTVSFARNSVEQVKEEARQCIAQAGKTGGYVLSSGCVVPRDAKKENVTVLREAAETYGVYEGGKLNWLS